MTPPGDPPGADVGLDVLCPRGAPLPAKGSQVEAWVSSLGTLSLASDLEAQRLSVTGNSASGCASVHERG